MDEGHVNDAGSSDAGSVGERGRGEAETFPERGELRDRDSMKESDKIGERGSGAPSRVTATHDGEGTDRNRSSRARVTVAAAFAAAALVAMALLAFLAVRAPGEVTDRYMQALSEGREGEAWSMLHAASRFKAEDDFEGYARMVRERMASVATWKVRLSHITGSRAYVDVELLRDGESDRFRLGLRNDGKGWVIYEPDSEEGYGGR